MIEVYQKEYLSEIMDYQKELYSLNFKEMKFDMFFYLDIASWYDMVEESERFSSYVLKNEHSVAGFYLFQQEYDVSYLMQMFVNKEFRQKGFGQKLLSHYENKSKEKGAKQLLLHASSMNEQAVSFYKRNGYSFYDVENLDNGEKRFVMLKKI